MACGAAYVSHSSLVTGVGMAGFLWSWIEAVLRGLSRVSCVQQIKGRSPVGARVRLPKNVTFAGPVPFPCDRSSRLLHRRPVVHGKSSIGKHEA